MASDAHGRGTMSVEEAAVILGISRNSAYEAVRRSEIPSLRLGRRILIPRSLFFRWLDGTDGRAESWPTTRT